jgi:hypothetical protein
LSGLLFVTLDPLLSVALLLVSLSMLLLLLSVVLGDVELEEGRRADARLSQSMDVLGRDVKGFIYVRVQYR